MSAVIRPCKRAMLFLQCRPQLFVVWQNDATVVCLVAKWCYLSAVIIHSNVQSISVCVCVCACVCVRVRACVCAAFVCRVAKEWKH